MAAGGIGAHALPVLAPTLAPRLMSTAGGLAAGAAWLEPEVLELLATPLLSASLGLLTAVQITRAFLLSSSSLGPLVLMVC